MLDGSSVRLTWLAAEVKQREAQSSDLNPSQANPKPTHDPGGGSLMREPRDRDRERDRGSDQWVPDAVAPRNLYAF